MNYKEIYNDLVLKTNGFTDTEGYYYVDTKPELQIAIDILKDAYANVERDGLDYLDKDPNGKKYKIKFSTPVLEEQFLYEDYSGDIMINTKKINESVLDSVYGLFTTIKSDDTFTRIVANTYIEMIKYLVNKYEGNIKALKKKFNNQLDPKKISNWLESNNLNIKPILNLSHAPLGEELYYIKSITQDAIGVANSKEDLQKFINDQKEQGNKYLFISQEKVLNISYSEEVLFEAMIEKHDQLNPKLWDSNNELKPEVKEKLNEIVNKFEENLRANEVDLDIEDVCIIGSNASYNYNDTSDIDLHIIADTSIYSDEDLALKTYLAYKSLFNDKYDPTVRGIDVEVYVEPHEVHANSRGIYSLNNGWLKEPEAMDIPEVDEAEIDKLSEPYKERAAEANTIEDVDKLIDDIYLQRQQSIQKDGEFGKGNLIFKFLRSLGILQDLKDKKVELENKEMSIEESSMEDKFNENLEKYFIEEDLCEDALESYPELLPGQLYELAPGHQMAIRDVVDNGSVILGTEIFEDDEYEFIEDYKHIQAMLFEYDAKLVDDPTKETTAEEVNTEDIGEDLTEYPNGLEFKFPDPKDTLQVYLDWEGIYGFTDDIIDFGEMGEDVLEGYLEDEGIYGYTHKLYQILNGDSAFCEGMSMEDFEAICRDNFLDYTNAIDDDVFDESLDEAKKGLLTYRGYLIRSFGDTGPEDIKYSILLKDGGYIPFGNGIKECKAYIDRCINNSMDKGETNLIDKFVTKEDISALDESLKEGLDEKFNGYAIDKNGNEVDFADNDFYELKYKLRDSLIGPKKELAREDLDNVIYDFLKNDKNILDPSNEMVQYVVNEVLDLLSDYYDLDESKPQWPKEIGAEYDWPDKDDDDEPRILPPDADDDDYDDKFDEDLGGTIPDDEWDNLTDDEKEILNKNRRVDYPDEIPFESLDESKDNRHVERGINWTWFYTDSEADANKWFFELMGVKPNDNTIDGPIERNHPGKYDSYWSFRMRNDLVDQLDEAKYLGSCDDKKQIKDEKKKGLIKKDKKSKYDIKADESLDEGTAFDSMPGFMSPEEIRAKEKSDQDTIAADKEAARLQRVADRKEKARAERTAEQKRHLKNEVNRLSYDVLAEILLDVAGETEEGYGPYDLSRDEVLGHLRSILGDRGILKKYKELFDPQYKVPRGGYDADNIPVEYAPNESLNESREFHVGDKFIDNNGRIIVIDELRDDGYIGYTIMKDGEVETMATGEGDLIDYHLAGDSDVMDAILTGNNFKEFKEDLNEAVDPEDPKAQALALYLDVTTDAVDNGYDTDIYEVGNEEYFVGTEDEAYNKAVDEIKMLYDDIGLDSFTPSFQEEILSDCLDQAAIDDFVEEEIKYFTEDEPDQNMVDYLEGLVDKTQYIIDTLGKDTFSDWAKDKLDLDAVAEKAISEDGVAHFIASYDGNEIDLGDGLYAYRLN